MDEIQLNLKESSNSQSFFLTNLHMEDLLICIMNFELYPLKEARYSYEIGGKGYIRDF
ncbi:hypothetical protein bcgnr5396_48540 [Bacillus cereus]